MARAHEEYVDVSVAFLKKVRGKRSQRQFSRVLGFKGNPVATWEAGRRYPSAATAFQAAVASGRDVVGAFHNFHPGLALSSVERQHLADWMDAIRGKTRIGEIADRLGSSRHAVGRWLTGATEPRFHEFLAFVDQVTGRCPVLLADIVDVSDVPHFGERFQKHEAARRLALELPWSEIVLRLLETQPPGDSPTNAKELLSSIPIEANEADALLNEMIRAGLAERSKTGRVSVSHTLNVEMGRSPDVQKRITKHWLNAGVARLEEGRGSDDLFAYNVISVNEADYRRIQKILRAAYQEIRAVVAKSTREECAAVIGIQQVKFPKSS